MRYAASWIQPLQWSVLPRGARTGSCFAIRAVYSSDERVTTGRAWRALARQRERERDRARSSRAEPRQRLAVAIGRVRHLVAARERQRDLARLPVEVLGID